MLTTKFQDLLLLSLYSIDVRIHEIALSKATLTANNAGFPRLDALYACLRAAKSWFDLFLSFSPAFYIRFSMPVFTQMAHCIIVLFRLLTLDDPIWDRRVVRDTTDLSSILEQLVERFDRVKAIENLDHGSEESKDMCSRSAKRIGSIKTWWDAKLAAELDNGVGLDETLAAEMTVDYFDDVWLRDILGQGDAQFDVNP